MRTIKFRGLRTDGKGWVYGGYFQHTPDEDGVRYYIFDFNEGAVEVIPESVGQFTGLHDKNGKEIFEGDIVTDGVGKYKIIYDLKLAGYQPYCIFRDEPENYCEVIGNIYENPELISKTPTHEH